MLGTFNYQFDGIGRRTDKGTDNTSDILNRTVAWTHDQSKTLTIKAHPAARVWFNGVEVENFTGQHQQTLTPPGSEGGWVPWETLAVLEGAGEGEGNPPANPLASPDAKAEKRGAVWVPPTAETLAYDAAGNRQSSAQWDYGWDAQNRLARVRSKNHTTAPQAYDLTFTYDSEGRRVKKHVIEYHNGAVIAEKTITFVWDGWDLLYERHQLPSGLTTLERKYLWGPDIANGAAGGAGGLLLIRETKGNTTTEIIPLYDGTGHVIALTDINKNLLASYAYGPFGEKITATGTHAQSNPWRYATKYLDEETGLYYFGFRYYDTTTGQWLSREPLGESESVNLYSYCHNDPVNKVDVLGLATVITDSAHKLPDVGNGANAEWLAEAVASLAGYRAEQNHIKNHYSEEVLGLVTNLMLESQMNMGAEEELALLRSYLNYATPALQRERFAAGLPAELTLHERKQLIRGFKPQSFNTEMLYKRVHELGDRQQNTKYVQGIAGGLLDVALTLIDGPLPFADGLVLSKGAAGAASKARVLSELPEYRKLEILLRNQRLKESPKTTYHSVKSSGAGQGVLNGIDPLFLNPKSRFGKAFYISDDAGTTLAELAHHGITGTHTIRYNLNLNKARVLDFTDPAVAKVWGYAGGGITPATQAIGTQAIDAGYDIIKFQSLRGSGSNYGVLSNFDMLLSPQMIVPTP